MNSKKFIESFVDNLELGTIVVSKDQSIKIWNRWVATHSGIDTEQAVNKTLEQVLDNALSNKISAGIESALTANRVTLISNRLHKNPLPLFRYASGERSNEELDHSIQISPMAGQDGEPLCLIQIFDMSSDTRKGQALVNAASRIKQTEEAVKEHKLHMSAVFESARDGIFIFSSSGEFIAANEASARIFGYERMGMMKKKIFELITDISKYKNHSLVEILDILGSNKTSIEVGGVKSCGTTFPIEFSVSKINDPDAPDQMLYVSVIRDITERKMSEERLERLSQYDPMTHLPNRSLFRDRLDQAIRRSKRFGKHFLVVILDIDRFKIINDSLGHELGDELLVNVGERLKECIREIDTVARMGGDEFALLLEDIDKQESAYSVSKKIVNVFKPHFVIGGHKLFVTTSLGVAVYPESGTTASDLLRNSDAAMYSAKAKGRNSIEFYSSELGGYSTERLKLEKDLTSALQNNEFFLNYQPLISLEKENVFGAEALIRWVHPEHGFVSPDKFIPIAEDTGLIVDIGKWVFETSCRFCKELHSQGFKDFRIAINISPRQFSDPEFYNNVKSILNEIDLSPNYVELEITENMLMENIDKNVTSLKILKDEGFRLSMDDFGTGYSSLSYINQFPLDTIKIDRSFVQGLPETLDSLSITKAILYMAKGLKLDVVAEGVETEQQKQFLKDELCELAQGYLISRPLIDKDFISWLKDYYAFKKQNQVTQE